MKEYLAKLLKALAEKNTAMQTALSKSAAEGATPSEETEAEIQALEKDIAAIEVNIERTKKQIKAIEDAEKKGFEEPAPTPGKDPAPKIETVRTLEKGVGFAMAVKATALAGKSIAAGAPVDAVTILKNWGAPKEVQDIIIAKTKAVVGSTTDADFASALVNQQVLTNEFIELLRPATILGRMTGFRNVPFNVKIPLQDGSSTVGWVGEKGQKSVTNPTFDSVTLGINKIAGIVVMSDELLKLSSPSADALVRDDLLKSIGGFVDTSFIDPTKAAVAGVSPASITNGLAAADAFAAAGTTAADYEVDFLKAITRFTESNLSLDGAYWLMSETRAAQLGLVRDALGNTYFEGMQFGAASRSLLGMPVITSQNVGKQIVLVKPSEILLADEGGVDFAMSSEASIQIGVNEGAPVMVNLFQDNLAAIRAERFITWKKSRAIGVVRIIYT